ncbi:Angiogenin, partial [Ophiophagus hannah]
MDEGVGRFALDVRHSSSLHHQVAIDPGIQSAIGGNMLPVEFAMTGFSLGKSWQGSQQQCHKEYQHRIGQHPKHELILLFKGFGLGLFIILAAALIMDTYAADYTKFLRQHYDNPKSKGGDHYCNKIMQSHGLSSPKCKMMNTFIHDMKQKITDVCGDQGVPFRGRLWCSKVQFWVTTCKAKGFSDNPPCDYREDASPRYIVIVCKNGLPVHYEEGKNSQREAILRETPSDQFFSSSNTVKSGLPHSARAIRSRKQ